jgi:outer membrane scaffolding protein for murein synthesis (MipA/OmpV family)
VQPPFRATLAAALTCLLLAPAHVAADQLPLWELGAGVSVLDFPDYRGSDERSTLALPFPYLIYRGEVLRLDREGLRGLLIESERVELDISANATIPVDSDDNRARNGMDDLDPTFEIGPSLNLTLLGSRTQTGEVQLRLPVRAVVATDFSRARAAGVVFEPRLNLDLRLRRAGLGWRLGVGAGPVFVSDNYAQYFYSVPAEDATPARPRFDAEGGYAGTQLTASVTWRGRSLWAGAFVRQDWLSGASFEDSPLVRQDHAFAAGVGIAYVFARSRRLVEAYD